MAAENILFILAHPLAALRAKERQIAVGMDLATPPKGSRVWIDEFVDMPVSEAAKVMASAKSNSSQSTG